MLHRFSNQIGTAWHGTHVVLLTCNYKTNELLSIFKSDHAPAEPINTTCSETLSRYLSIGYILIHAFPLNASEVQYILIYR